MLLLFVGGGLDKGNLTETHPQTQAALKCLAEAPQSIAEPRVKTAVRGKN